jgi:apolipoprotein N-acyltransferase
MKVKAALHAVFAAGLITLAFPPFNLVLLVFVALVPWLLALRQMNGRQAFWSGLLFGFAFYLGQMWFLQPFVARWTGSPFLGVVPWILTALLGMWYFAPLGWWINRCYVHGRVWWIPIGWAGLEAIRSLIPAFAFPWGLLATPLWIMPPIVQSAAAGTIFLVSAWVALVNVLAVQIMSERNPAQAMRMATVVATIALVSIVRWGQPPDGDERTLFAGQIGVDMAFGDPATEPQRIAQATRRLIDTAQANGADLLILPEGITRGGDAFPPASPLGEAPPVPVVFGGQRGTGPVYQSAYSYDGRWQVADKTRLVIFGEYVPLRDRLPFLRAFNLPSGDLAPGQAVTALDVNGIRVGPVICFEALFFDVARRQAFNGAQVLAVLSIDDWYKGTGAPEQLFSHAVWRAIENGLPVVRSATLGVTAAIDARGNVLSRAPVGQLQALRVELELPRQSDAFRYNWLFPIACTIALAALACEMAWRDRTERKT